MKRRNWISANTAARTAVTLVVFAVVFCFLCVGSYTREAATYDEPAHVVAGYAMWTQGDYRFSPDHLPFSRLWAAAPLLFMDGVRLDAGEIRAVSTDDWMLRRQFDVAHRFLYEWNDADRLLYRARFMVVLLGIALGVLVFLWARDLFGFVPAVAVLALYALEPNVLAHSRLVTADIALTCFAFGTSYFIWRVSRNLTLGNVVGLGLCFMLAQITKTWALLLLAPLTIVLLVRALESRPWSCGTARTPIATRAGRTLAAIGVVLLVTMVALLGIWGSYRFRYSPDPAGVDRIQLQNSGMVRARLGEAPRALLWMDEHRLLPNAYLQGFLYGTATIQRRPSFLNGAYRDRGWWSYFPYAILIKTPLTVLLMAGVGLVGSILGPRRTAIPAGQVATAAFEGPVFDRTSLAQLLLTPALFLVVAMAGPIQIGLRHVLSVYPFVLLLAGAAAATRFARIRSLGLVAIVALSAVELASVFPHCLAFGNILIGGPARLHEHLLDSNLDWGQDLKALGRFMRERSIGHVNLCYFGTAAPSYYGIESTPLPGAPFFAESEARLPELPGFVAVSATHLHGAQFIPSWRGFYAPLLARTPEAVLGHSIFVYWVEEPWWDAAVFGGGEPNPRDPGSSR